MKLFYKYYWKDIYYDIKWGLKNLKTYFKVVWGARPWDFNYTPLEMLKKNLEVLLPCIENGFEVDESRLVKVANIKRCIVLIDRLLKDDYIGELGGLAASNFPIDFVPVDDSPESDVKMYKMKEHRTPEEIEQDGQTLRHSITLQENDWIELWEIIKRDSQGWWD